MHEQRETDTQQDAGLSSFPSLSAQSQDPPSQDFDGCVSVGGLKPAAAYAVAALVKFLEDQPSTQAAKDGRGDAPCPCSLSSSFARPLEDEVRGVDEVIQQWLKREANPPAHRLPPVPKPPVSCLKGKGPAEIGHRTPGQSLEFKLPSNPETKRPSVFVMGTEEVEGIMMSCDSDGSEPDSDWSSELRSDTVGTTSIETGMGTRSHTDPQTEDMFTALRSIRTDKKRDDSTSSLATMELDKHGEFLFRMDTGMGKDGLVRLSATVVNQHVAILLVHAQSGEILGWNNKMVEYTGVPALAAIGNEITAFLPFSDDQKYVCNTFSALNESADDAQTKSRILSFMKSDGVNLCHLTMTFVTSKEGTPVIAAFGIHRSGSSDRLYCKWVLKQVCPKLRSLLDVKAPSPSPLVDNRRENENPTIAVYPDVPEITLLSVGGDVTPPVSPPVAPYPGIHVQQDGTKHSSSFGRSLTDAVCIIERAQYVDTSKWAPLNIKTTFKKLAMNYQDACQTSGEDAVITLSLGDDMPQEVATDLVKLPEAIAYLVTNAVKYSKGFSREVKIEVKYDELCSGLDDDEDMGTVVVEVINEGTPVPQCVHDLLRGDSDGPADGAGMGLLKIRDSLMSMGAKLHFERRLITPKPRRVKSWSRSTASTLSSISRINSGSTLKGAPLLANGETYVNVAVVSLPYIPTDEEDLMLGSMKGVSMHRENGPRDLMLAGDTREASKEVQEARQESLEIGADTYIRCMVVEPNAAYKIAFCNYFWQQSMFMSLADSPKDVRERLSFLDVVVIDVDDEDDETGKLLSYLSSDESCDSVEVMLASRALNSELKKVISNANWLGAQLPLNAGEMHKTLDEIELRILKKRIQERHVEEARLLFGSGGYAAIGFGCEPMYPNHTTLHRNLSWERGKLLGTGSFGKVYEATTGMTGGKMAVKCIPLAAGGLDEESLLNEVKLMSEFEHPNIIHYFYSEVTSTELLIFMEYAQGGSLSGKIPKGGFRETEVGGYLSDITKGLLYLHSKGIAHRDIKVANVLLSRGVCKLTDFGTATKTNKPVSRSNPVQQEAEETVGTLAYMAPEVAEGRSSLLSADIWSLGCLLMELCTKRPPFAHKGTGFVVVKYVTSLKPSEQVDYGAHNYGPNALSFMSDCLRVLPEDRPQCSELLDSHLIRSHVMAKKEKKKNMARDVRDASMANLRDLKTGGKLLHAPDASPPSSTKGARSYSCPMECFIVDVEAGPVAAPPTVSMDAKLAESTGTTPPSTNLRPKAAEQDKKLCNASGVSVFSGWGGSDEDESDEEEPPAAPAVAAKKEVVPSQQERANRAVTDLLRQSFTNAFPLSL